MSSRKQKALLALVLLSALALYLSIAWKDIGTLSRNGFLYDDSYYAFQIARNAAAGRGFTFDGVHPTTGFQPLYVFILVPIFMISGGSATLPISIALSMLAVFTTLTAYLVYKIARRYAGFAASLIAGAIWALSPIVAKQGTNGLETAMATFMISLSIFFYLSRVRNERDAGPGRFMVLGMLLGITVLSRIDGIFLALVITLDYLILLRRRKEPNSALARLALLPAGVSVLYGPWLIANMLSCGSAFQDSGCATRFLSLAYTTYFHNGHAGLASTGPDASFIWEQFRHAVSTLKVAPPIHVIFRAIDKAGVLAGSYRSFHMAGDILGLGVLASAGYLIFRWRRDPGRKDRRELDFLLLFCGVLVLAYSTYIFGAFFFMRYFYPIFLVACLYLAIFLDDIFNWIDLRPRVLKTAAVSSAAVYFIIFAAFTYSQVFRTKPIYPFYDIARWVEENTDEDDSVGVFQCGMIGYFSNRKTINLDGKVNRDALEALKTGSLVEYIEHEDLDMILDHERILEIFLGAGRGNLRNECVSISTATMEAPCGWIAIHKESFYNLGMSSGSTPAASEDNSFLMVK